MQGTMSTKTHVPQCPEFYTEVPKPSGGIPLVHDLSGLRNHTDGPGDVADSTILEFEYKIIQSETVVADHKDAWATRSDSKHSMPCTELMSYDQEDSCCGSTKSDVAICGSESSVSDSTNSLSGSEISYRKCSTSYYIASQGLGT